MGNVKLNKVSATLIFIVILALPLVVVKVSSQALYGPVTPDLLVHVYLSEEAEFRALEEGEIDITDWPLDPDTLARFETNTDIALRLGYALHIFQIDIDNQRWPTGVTLPRDYDLATGTWKHYYGTSEWDDEAAMFRHAIAHLTPKEKIEKEVLAGTGVRIQTHIPYPALAEYTDYESLDAKGLIHDYDMFEAAAILDAAGFTQMEAEGVTNPYYDPETPGSAQYLRRDPQNPTDPLQTLKFWIRMDDRLRRDSGLLLTTELRKAGIQVEDIVTERTVCFKNVMIDYDFHLYTGGWGDDMYSLDWDIGYLYDLYHSEQYWGGTDTSYFDGLGWSVNYNGFSHNYTKDAGLAGSIGAQEDYYDYWAHMIRYGKTLDEIYDAGLQAQEVAAGSVPSIPLYSRLATKAYRAEWSGVVGAEGIGIDNRWSFLNMYNPTDNIIDWGFKSMLEGPNPITSQWSWDRKIVGLIYDSLIGRNPYNPAEEFGWLAEDWATGSWEPGKGYVLFKLREANPTAGVQLPTFHNGDPMRPLDVAFSLIFARDSGSGVAWSYSNLKDIVKVEIPDPVPTWLVGTDIEQNTALNPREVKVYFDVESYWMLHWAGFVPILNEKIWHAANDALGWGYNTAVWDPMAVRNYRPWVEDSDGDGETDFQEDGAGPWKLVGYAPEGPIEAATSISFDANTNFYLSQDYIANYLTYAFHVLGDFNDDGVVDGIDGDILYKTFGTDMWNYPWGTGYDEYNPAVDIYPSSWDMFNGVPSYGDGIIFAEEHEIWYSYFGVTSGLTSTGMSSDQAINSDGFNSEFLKDSEDLTATSTQSDGTPTMYVDTYPPSGSGIIVDESLQPGQIPVSGVSIINSYPTNHNTNGSVINSTYAYDLDQLTAAFYNITANPPYPGYTYFEVTNFNTTITKEYHVLGIDVKLNYSFTGTDVEYRILLYVGDAYKTLRNWISFQQPTPRVRTFYRVEEPNDVVWNWTDINNIRIRVETRKLLDTGTGNFSLYEAWVSLPVDRIVVSVAVANVKNLRTWGFFLNWSGPILDITYVREGPLLRQKGASTSLLWKKSNIANQTKVSGTLGRSRGVDGDGTLAYIEFQVENYGSSELQLYNTRLITSFKGPISHTTVDGYFRNKYPGDVDGDKYVGSADFSILAGAYGSSEGQPAYEREADFELDGYVGSADFSVLAGNYGKTFP